ncbi:uncharacterized protein LOC126733893 [Anthonomus grandis grandis]|uniref:uncharacterized protein LOC126733893 n=1 Tax=Anthonomus grandis grandis TaxID=2921223 RepID=UPI0021664EE4|nr:uncharacterized protein LOC126733893 [Anthonomus grandis grandis]
MADEEQRESCESDRAGTSSSAIIGGSDSASINNQMMLMFKMQQESNSNFQSQIMQILSTMANAQATQAEAALQSSVEQAHVQSVAVVGPGPKVMAAAASSQICLTIFDPDDTPFTMVEWMDDVSRIQAELRISDTVTVLKAGHALRGRAARFYRHWKPIVRDWASFRRDFEVAFPEKGTPATQLRACLAIMSNNFDSLVEYGNAKLLAIRRFYADFPWRIVLSLVEHDIQSAEVKNRICLQSPECDADLLKLLAVCDAAKLSEVNRVRESRKRPNNSREDHPAFHGKCRQCHRFGHKQIDCKQGIVSNMEKPLPGPSGANINYPSRDQTKTVMLNTCTYCQKKGHSEDTCYKKNGFPKRVMLSQNTRFVQSPPLATLTNDSTITSISYLVDTGADVSILHEKVAKKLNLKIQPSNQCLAGIGKSIMKAIGRSTAIMFTPTMTLEMDFLVVPDGSIPGGDVDALIGLDVLKRPGVKVEVNENSVDIVYDPLSMSRICTVRTFDESRLDLSELDEPLSNAIKTLLQQAINQTPPAVTTGKLIITLRDPQPVAYKPRHLSYGERLQVKQIIQEQLDTGIIRVSESAYASPIVLVKKRNGDTRLCVDYREVNKQVVRNNYPLPRIQDQIDALSKAKYFCTLDMKSGFYQIEVEEKSKHITAFVTPDGLYEYNRMPFGFVTSPPTYQKAIDKALGLLKDDIAFVYIDDVLCPARTTEEGFNNLRLVVDTLSKSGFVLNLEKCSFF